MTTASSRHYQQMEKALSFLHEHRADQPGLKDLAAHLHTSEYHLQRLFVQWVGISPKRFLQFLNREYCKTLLDKGYSTLETSVQAGFSSSSRLHELFIKSEGITPAQYRHHGSNLHITYGFHDSPFGTCLLAMTDQGICHLSFVTENEQQALQALQAAWPLSRLELAEQRTGSVHQQIFPAAGPGGGEIRLLLKGSQFQLQVWQALLDIPFGRVDHYQGLAGRLGKPAASRAVASAIARNQVAWLIPCHRVIRKIGESGDYRWGKSRKALMLACEAALRENHPFTPE